MNKSFRTLVLLAALASTAVAQSPIPPNVLVATDQVEAKEFTSWIEEDVSKYDGTYTGDVGGDGVGKFVFKVAKSKEGPSLASGSYTHTIAGTEPIVVKIEKLLSFGDPNNLFTAGAFDVVFVKYGKIAGVIVGNVFVPKK